MFVFYRNLVTKSLKNVFLLLLFGFVTDKILFYTCNEKKKKKIKSPIYQDCHCVLTHPYISFPLIFKIYTQTSETNVPAVNSFKVMFLQAGGHISFIINQLLVSYCIVCYCWTLRSSELKSLIHKSAEVCQSDGFCHYHVSV